MKPFSKNFDFQAQVAALAFTAYPSPAQVCFCKPVGGPQYFQ